MRFLTLLLALLAFTPSAFALVDDRLLEINSAARADAVRAELRTFIWGTTTLPSTRPTGVDTSSPIPGLDGLYSAVKILDVKYVYDAATSQCEISRAYYFQAASPNGTLMLLHEGHDRFDSAAFVDGYVTPGVDSSAAGRQRFVRALLQNGYSVILAFMPRYRPHIDPPPPGCTAEAAQWPNGPAGTYHDHAWMFANRGTNGAVLKYFLDPVVQWVNYALTDANASRVVMAGLSGGGWTTTLAAAIDPRIVRSYTVAGSLPLYMRKCMSNGDTEQTLDSLYQIANYLDLYLLGTYPGRKQIQILLRHDIYFGDDPVTMFESENGATWAQMLRRYEAAVRNAAHALGSAPSFRIEIDEGTATHAYTRNTAFNVILGDLNEDRREVGIAAETDVFLRGTDGQIIRRTSAGWTAMGIQASGTPAVVENAAGVQRTDLFYRDETNILRHVHRTNGAWSTPATLTLPAGYRALADPVAVATLDGIDIVAVAAKWRSGTTIRLPCPSNPPFNDATPRSDYDVFHWTWTPSGGLIASSPVTVDGQVLSASNEIRAAVGMPAVVRFNSQVHIFVRAENALLYHLKHNGTTWVANAVSALPTGGFPTAIVANNAIRVYTRSRGNALYEFSGTGSGTWTQSTVPVAMTGSPSAIVTATDVKVFVRGLDGKITTCTRPIASTQWGNPVSLGGSAISGSPAVTPGGVVAGAHKSTPETVVRHNGSAWTSFGTTEAAPVSFSATVSSASPTTINLTWTASSSDAGNTFVVERSAGSGFERIDPPVSGTSYNDSDVDANRSYIYRVRSATSWAYKADLATTVHFPAIDPRGPIQAQNLRDARSATNMARVAAGLAPVTFGDPSKAPVRTTDVTTLRTYLIEAFQAAGLTVPTFTTIPPRGAVLRGHFLELTNAVK